MPLIYFHGNCNRCKEHNDTVWIEQILSYKAVFFHIVTTINCTFLPATRSLHVTAVTAETLHPVPHCAHIHCLVSRNICKHQWLTVGAIFSMWRNSFPHLCFIGTSMSDAILSDWPSAAICHIATKCNRVLVGRFNLYCCTNNVHLWRHGPT